MTLPTFLIIGAQKAGTTSLWHYLRHHPQVFMPEAKELDFFVAERSWARGLDWYEQQFAEAGDASAVGEASPLYTMFPSFAGVPERIASTIPDVHLVYMVRNPLERLRSHYLHLVADGSEQRPITTAIRQRSLVPFGLYAMQIERYLKHFPADQLLVVPSERLQDDRAGTMRHVLRFLGVDAETLPDQVTTEIHRSADKRIPRVRWADPDRTPGLRAVAHRLPGRGGRALMRLLTRPVNKTSTEIPADIEAELIERFETQLPLVRDLVQRTWPDWQGWTWTRRAEQGPAAAP